jgi:hypothetical protein
MVGDFLIESRCREGHSSSASFRKHSREHVEEVARTLSDRCCFVVGHDGEECGSRVAHVVTHLGQSHSLMLPPPKKDTQPSMRAVRPTVIIVNDGPVSSSDMCPPPPSTEPDEDESID